MIPFGLKGDPRTFQRRLLKDTFDQRDQRYSRISWLYMIPDISILALIEGLDINDLIHVNNLLIYVNLAVRQKLTLPYYKENIFITNDFL